MWVKFARLRKTALFVVLWEGCLSPRGSRGVVFGLSTYLGVILVAKTASVPLYFNFII